jgi:hypothetical protein
MARWTASAKWAEGPALDGQRDMPLALRLSEGLGISARGQPTGLFLYARDCASRSALWREQSRYPASAACAKNLAWCSAPCIADHRGSPLSGLPRSANENCLGSLDVGRKAGTSVLINLGVVDAKF